MQYEVKAEQGKIKAFEGTMIFTELLVKLVEKALSLKMLEISTEALYANGGVEDGEIAWLFTLPNGTVTADAAVVGGYFTKLVLEQVEDLMAGNYFKAVKMLIAEIDKVQCELVDVKRKGDFVA